MTKQERVALLYTKELGFLGNARAPGHWRKGGGKATRDEDPTCSEYSKAVSHGIEGVYQHAAQVQDERQRLAAQRQAQIAMLHRAVARGDVRPEELPDWAQLDATAPAPLTYSTHVERRLTQKRQKGVVADQQAQERARSALVQLADKWGARLKGSVWSV
jgi:hypothetical protein